MQKCKNSKIGIYKFIYVEKCKIEDVKMENYNKIKSVKRGIENIKTASHIS